MRNEEKHLVRELHGFFKEYLKQKNFVIISTAFHLVALLTLVFFLEIFVITWSINLKIWLFCLMRVFLLLTI